MCHYQAATIYDYLYHIQNNTLQIGFHFYSNKFNCTEVKNGKVSFTFLVNGKDVTIDMLTKLYIKKIKRSISNYQDFEKRGSFDYEEWKHDDIKGGSVKHIYNIPFIAGFEYQSDGNLHVVEFIRDYSKITINKKFLFEVYNEGMMYLTGKGFKKNRAEAIKLLCEAAEQLHQAANDELIKLGK